eukprot:6598971-Pyramimonas_sp.AAC.1
MAMLIFRLVYLPRLPQHAPTMLLRIIGASLSSESSGGRMMCDDPQGCGHAPTTTTRCTPPWTSTPSSAQSGQTPKVFAAQVKTAARPPVRRRPRAHTTMAQEPLALQRQRTGPKTHH